MTQPTTCPPLQGLPAADLGELVRRVRAYNAAALTTEHRKKLQLLYGILVQHFASLAGAAPLPLASLDALVPHLIEMTPQVGWRGGLLAGGGSCGVGVLAGGNAGRRCAWWCGGGASQPHLTVATVAPMSPAYTAPASAQVIPRPFSLTLPPGPAQVPFYAATLARARLQRAQQRLAAALRSADPAQRAAAWPAPRALLLLKLWATVFPVTDKRHPVLTPAGVLACSALALCPLARPHHVALGLYLSSLTLHLHSAARRFVPEPLSFAVSLLESALPAGYQPAAGSGSAASAAAQQEQQQLGAAVEEPRWLCIPSQQQPSEPPADLPATAEAVQPLQLERVLSLASAAAAAQQQGAAAGAAGGAGGAQEAEAYFASPGCKTSAAAAAARLVARCAEVWAGVEALPEALAPALRALRAIVAAGAELDAAQRAQHSGKPKKQQRRQQQQAQQEGGAPHFALAPGLVAVCRQALEAAEAAAEGVRARRKPLVNPALTKVAEAKLFNPRYEEDYAQGKDYDPDRWGGVGVGAGIQAP